MDKKPLIGVITASASQSEQRQLLEGITAQALQLGAVTAVFSNIYNSSEYFADVQVENRIYDLILSRSIDGLILTAESILNAELQQSIYRNLTARSDIPIIVIGAELEGFICINNDVALDMEDIVNHLTQVHGFTDIDLLTGWAEMETSQQRINGYRKALEAQRIPFEESRIIYGDYWMTSGEKLAREYMEGRRKMPQAIVCANDYMAYGLCDAFLAGGVSLPEDVTVIVYEYVGERFYHAPILTTYQRSRRAMGAQAVNLLWEKMTGFRSEPIPLSGCMIYGNTCSCGADWKRMDNELQSVRREQFYSKLNLVGNFEQQLTLCRSIADYVNVLQQFAYLIRDILGLHLCLYENWCSTEISGGMLQETDTMVHYRIITHRDAPDEPDFFRRSDLFPDTVLQSESGDVLYFCPIFFSGRELGYFIVQYDHPDCYDIIFRDWLKIAANALEILRMKNDIVTLLECRNLSEFHDSITGLYNEKGLRQELNRSLKQADGGDVLLLLIRSELFFDNSSLDGQELSLRMDMETAEYLRKEAAVPNSFCAKLSDKLYAFAAAGCISAESSRCLEDRLRMLISHAPLYSEYCGVDSLVLCMACQPAEGFQLDNMLQMLRDEMNQKTAVMIEKRSHPNYQEYAALRDKLYRNPCSAWGSQQTCREFRLSYGHFRATYKALFGISFHQDVIRSRIALAKYLLMTTALSMPLIAEKCGYEDDKYFLRQFRQLTGMTPHAYKSGGF